MLVFCCVYFFHGEPYYFDAKHERTETTESFVAVRGTVYFDFVFLSFPLVGRSVCSCDAHVLSTLLQVVCT